MAPNNPDEPSFADEMARIGVQPIPDKRSSKQRSSQPRSSQLRSSQLRSSQQSPPSVLAAAWTQDSGPDSVSASDDERLLLRVRLAEAEKELSQLRARIERSAQQQSVLELAWKRERDGMVERWNQERNRLAQRELDMRARLNAAEQTLASHMTLGAVLEQRGCMDVSEAAAVLRGLLDIRPREVMETVDMISTDALAQLLDQRVALVAEGVDMESGPDCVVVRVSPERCELTGGSDIRAGFRRFADACQRAGIRHVTIVGGSPAYRRQLQRLAKRSGAEVGLNLVSGTQRRTRKRAEADMRASNLVVIWGATELDHSVSAVYTGAPEKLMYVHHRGISRMLVHVAEGLGRRT